MLRRPVLVVIVALACASPASAATLSSGPAERHDQREPVAHRVRPARRRHAQRGAADGARVPHRRRLVACDRGRLDASRRTHARRGRSDVRPGGASPPGEHRSSRQRRARADARTRTSTTRRSTRPALGFAARAGRALPRLRRALQRGRPARRRRSRTTSPTARTSPSDRAIAGVRPAAGLQRRATTRPTSRSRGCCRRAATACSSTTTRRSRFPLGGAAPGASRSTAARLDLRVFAGPRPADALRRFTARRRPPAAAPPRRSTSAPGSSRPAATPPRTHRDAARRRRAGSVAQTYTHYLPCGDQRGHAAAERARDRARCTPPASPSPRTSTR